jgi:O-antigen/teichoic acid export membrane protein
MVIKNVISVWSGFLLSVVIMFIITPTMISKLGSERYGLWIFLMNFTGYYGLIDMGLRSGITQSVTRRIAKNDRAGLVEFLSGIFPLVIKTALGIVFVVGLIAVLLAISLKEPAVPRLELFNIILIQALTVGLTILLFPFECVVSGCGRFDISVGISVPMKILSACCTWLVLHLSGNLLILCLVFFGFNFAEQLLRCAASTWLVPELWDVRPKSDSKAKSELYRVGGWTFVFQTSNTMLNSFNVMLLGWWFPLSNLVPYNLSNSVADYLSKITTLASMVLFPEFVRVKHHFGISKTRELYYLCTRLSLAIAVAGLIGGWFWIEDFMGLWLREVDGKDRFIPFIKSLFLIFGFINILRAIRAIGFQLLGSEDQMEFMGRSAFREAAFAVPCAILLCYFLGVTGLPLGNLFVLIASTIVFLMPKYANLLGEPYSRFALNTLARPALYGMVSFISVGILVRQVGAIDSWFLFLSRAFLPTLLIFLLLLPMTLTSSELKVILLRLGALIGFRQVR